MAIDSLGSERDEHPNKTREKTGRKKLTRGGGKGGETIIPYAHYVV